MNNGKINVLFSRPKEKLVDAFNVLPCNRFNVHAFPTINIEPVEQSTEIENAFKSIKYFDILVFTSHYAVIHTMEHLQRLNIPLSNLGNSTICAVGPMVSQQLGLYDLNTHMIPQEYTASSLCDLFPWVSKNSKTVLFPKGDRALGVLEGNLQKKGYKVVSPIVYQTKFRSDLHTHIESKFSTMTIDCMAFTSPSSVESLVTTLSALKDPALVSDSVIAAIGPTTQKACNEAGWPAVILPEEFTVQSMARSIQRYFQKNPKAL